MIGSTHGIYVFPFPLVIAGFVIMAEKRKQIWFGLKITLLHMGNEQRSAV